MRKLYLPLVLALFTGLPAVFGQLTGLGNAPVEISVDPIDGSTRFENGIAIAENNVQIHYGDYSMYSDYAEYNPDTRDVLLIGNIRIYTPKEVLTGERALFNLETKQMRALEFAGTHYPLLFRTFSLRALSPTEFRARDGIFTTDDSSQPSWHVKARTVRIYRNDRVVFVNSAFYIGNVPIFWFPYIFASITNTGFQFLPGYYSPWGAFLQTAYSFPLGDGDNFIGKVHFDYRTKLGVALGYDMKFKYGKDDRSYGDLVTYYAWNQQPGGDEGSGKEGRYRLSFRHRLFLTDDIYATADINILSDEQFLQTFYPALYQVDPQPDTYISLTKWDSFYTGNLIARWQANNFQETTERLPDFDYEFKDHALFGSPIYYDGSTGVASLTRAFAKGEGIDNADFPNYSATRFDSLNQISIPHTFFGWLSIVPVGGFRMTYYNQGGTFDNYTNSAGQILDPATTLNTPTPKLTETGPVFRPVVNFNIEASTKISRAFEKIQIRWLGIDGLRHVFQPYVDYSVVKNFGPAPDQVLQFDRVSPSTELLPITFPQFTAVDSIASWDIARMGMRNSLQTRRDNQTFQWLTLDTYVDYNIVNPYQAGTLSNFYNIAAIRPVPWFTLISETQLPLDSQGYTLANTQFQFQPVRDFSFSVGHTYIQGNPDFTNSSQVDFTAYWRINDNWGFSIYEQYEYDQNILEFQRYLIHRDLSSWVASFGIEVQQSQGVAPDYGVVLVFTLKDAPQVSLPVSFTTASGNNNGPASGL